METENMHFTQRLVDQVWGNVCEYFRTTPDKVGVSAPVAGKDIPERCSLADAVRVMDARLPYAVKTAAFK